MLLKEAWSPSVEENNMNTIRNRELKATQEIVNTEGYERAISVLGDQMLNSDWQYIENTDQRYMVSKDGRVITTKGTPKFMTGSVASNGYRQFNLRMNGSRKQALGHRLVAEAFIEKNGINRKQVNHMNGIKLDNHVDNLEWSSAQENQIHAIETGLKGKSVMKRERVLRTKDTTPNHLRYGAAFVFSVQPDGGEKTLIVGARELEIHVGSQIRDMKNAIENGFLFKGLYIEKLGTVADVYRDERIEAGYTYNV